MAVDNDTRWKRVQAARKRQEEVADHLAARVANRIKREAIAETKRLVAAGEEVTDIARAAAGLPLKYKPPPVVPEGKRLICRHCKQEILVEKWEWCAEAQKNLRSWGAIVVDGKVVRG